jgi:phenylalanyl-tRNA synthetase beta chain
MKVSYIWLKDYVDFDLTPDELAENLTMVGFEVEEIIETIPKFENIVVGKVKSCIKHPNADRLSICEVELPGKVHQVICGAPNVKAGQNIPFAQVGVSLPNGLKIKKAKIRGTESFGMICSKEELGLAEHSDGIWELPKDWSLGEDVYSKMSDKKDFIFDIAITPNRPDAMSMIGIAREVASFTDSELKIPTISLKEDNEPASNCIEIDIQNPEGCPRYAAMVIKDIEIKPSPNWMANRLTSAGVRPINNIVDITNFVLLETGQPLHAFDYNHIEKSKIIVRFSKIDEKFMTLDGKDRELPNETVLICDGKNPVAIGGIMGGLNSEVTEKTETVLLESAYFNPVNISRSSKRLGLSTEASQRFERGMDPNGVIYAANRAAQLMNELAGGKILKGAVDNYPKKIESKIVDVRIQRINKVLGTSISEKEITKILNSLAVKYENGKATIPTFRPDLEREVDIIEEIARSITFENIPVKEKTTIYYENQANDKDNYLSFLKMKLVQLELNEAFTNSMIPKEIIIDQNKEDYLITIYNPISDDMNIMRPSLIPGLLKSVNYNLNRNQPNIRLFELGRIFRKINDQFESEQPYYISGVICGYNKNPNWNENTTIVDFYDIKGLVESLLNKIFLDKVDFILYDSHIYLDNKNTLAVNKGEKFLGYFGKIKHEVLNKFDIESDVFAFEFNADLLFDLRNINRKYKPFSKYPFVEKDLAFVFDKKVNSNEIIKTIAVAGGSLVESVNVFDVFTGANIGQNKKSIAFRIKFQSDNKTLQDEEVQGLFLKIINKIESTFNAKLRE